MFKKMMFTTDFSNESLLSLPLATALAASHHSKLFIVYVSENSVPIAVLPPVGAAPYPPPEAPEREELLEKLNSVIPDNSNIAFEHVLLSGVVGEEIVRFGEDSDIDLIVMSTSGRSGLERFLLGSVAEHVVRHATCPVLTFNAERQQHQ